MKKPDIITSAPTLQGKPANGDSRKEKPLTVFKGEFKEMKSYVLDVRSALAINALSIKLCKMTELIGCTCKNGSNVRRCLDRMKEVALPKTKLAMGDDRFTLSQNLVDVEISKYQTHDYVNRPTIMKNWLQAAYYLGWGKQRKSTRSKLQYLPGFNQARKDYVVMALIKLIQGVTFNFEKNTYIYDQMNDTQ